MRWAVENRAAIRAPGNGSWGATEDNQAHRAVRAAEARIRAVTWEDKDRPCGLAQIDGRRFARLEASLSAKSTSGRRWKCRPSGDDLAVDAHHLARLPGASGEPCRPRRSGPGGPPTGFPDPGRQVWSEPPHRIYKSTGADHPQAGPLGLQGSRYGIRAYPTFPAHRVAPEKPEPYRPGRGFIIGTS